MGSKISAERSWASSSLIVEFNFALCEAQNIAVSEKQFRYEVISLYHAAKTVYHIAQAIYHEGTQLHYAPAVLLFLAIPPAEW